MVVTPGGSFEYAVVVRNRSDAASVATKARTFKSLNSVIATSDEEIGEASDVQALSAGESANGVATFTARASDSVGSVLWVGACVDATQGGVEFGQNVAY